MAKPGTHSSGLSALVAAALLFSFALFQGLATKHARDFLIFRLGSQLAARGENPYDLARIRQHVAAAYPEGDDNTQEFVANCGYFLPPLAVVLFLPFAAMPTLAATVCWACATGCAGFFIARLPEVSRARGSAPLTVLPRSLIPFVLVLNPLALAVVLVGQITVLSVGCVAAGLWCLDRGRPWLTATLWVLPFIKPHLALPLLPLLVFLGGWRPAALLIALVVALNFAGATLVGGSPLFLRDYLDYLSQAHRAVGYNRAELNPTITSWNRLLFTAGGPLVELTALTTIAGDLVWFSLVLGRVAWAGTRPQASWAIAAAAVGSVLCAQVLVYELLILTLVVPWVRDLFAAQFRFRGWLAVALLSLQLIPQAAIGALGLVFPPALGVALLAMLVLMGPVEDAQLRTEP
jgi:hypothetical protein